MYNGGGLPPHIFLYPAHPMPDDDIKRAAARADLCRFLAACYYEPGPELGEERVFDAMVEAATGIDPALAAHARRLGAAFATEGHEALLVDYSRLFLGPIQALAKPYGSVWLETDAGLMQESTTAVLKLYEKGGFEIAEDFRELPDHIAAELEFLYLLLFREARASRDADAKAGRRIAVLRTRFLDQHLGAWVGPFTDAVTAGATSEFYRVLAALTAGFVRMEARRRA